MPNLFKVTCPGKNKAISEMTTAEFCPFDNTAIIGVSIAIALMGLALRDYSITNINNRSKCGYSRINGACGL